MELKLDKTTKILLGAIALGLFLNASNVFIDKAYANTVQRIAICDASGSSCAPVDRQKGIYILDYLEARQRFN
jgi:hypothetical protein